MKMPSSSVKQFASIPLSSEIKVNIETIKNVLGDPHDLIVREFTLAIADHPSAIICMDGLIDSTIIHDKLVKHMQLFVPLTGTKIPEAANEIVPFLLKELLPVIEITVGTTLEDALTPILSGDTVLFIEGTEQIIIVDSKGWKGRGIEEPVSEGLVRGPRDGFTECIRDNSALIRRRIKDPMLRYDSSKVGRRSKTEMIIGYIEGIVNPDIVSEVKRRLATIDIDAVEESGYIEQWIEDNFMSPFPQVQSTERPDKVAAALLEGRVAILLDGTPFVLIAPVTMSMLLHSPEDFYERWMVGSLTRLLRYIGAFFAVFSPALYIALIAFHPGLIPSDLAFSIAATREGVPFPAFAESVLMVTTMELLQEAGIRLPRPIGQTVGIVGGLVIGEAAVSAGIVSPVMVIVVAMTAIASFAIPSYNMALAFRIIRFGVMMAAAMFGLYGVVLSFIVICIHLSNLQSFGVPYLTPFAPDLLKDWKDLILRSPIAALKKRPEMLQTVDKTRMGKGDSP
ncbi:spore germination protein [Paenibacillus sp. MBLB4367]|uniref:spore germination protein n=1 Tax=Paenibacillus sp. MBLB4367 TaxID=3384767 RepID=UPI0039080149